MTLIDYLNILSEMIITDWQFFVGTYSRPPRL